MRIYYRSFANIEWALMLDKSMMMKDSIIKTLYDHVLQLIPKQKKAYAEYCIEKMIEINPEDAKGYICAVLIYTSSNDLSELETSLIEFEKLNEWNKAIQYAKDNEKEELERILRQSQCERKYHKAALLFANECFEDAKKGFKECRDYKDTADLISYIEMIPEKKAEVNVQITAIDKLISEKDELRATISRENAQKMENETDIERLTKEDQEIQYEIDSSTGPFAFMKKNRLREEKSAKYHRLQSLKNDNEVLICQLHKHEEHLESYQDDEEYAYQKAMIYFHFRFYKTAYEMLSLLSERKDVKTLLNNDTWLGLVKEANLGRY